MGSYGGERQCRERGLRGSAKCPLINSKESNGADRAAGFRQTCCRHCRTTPPVVIGNIVYASDGDPE